ncbi:hypothetical protein LSAT2_022174 [Lamellibrachia satsuma]|nr:hypothetical protein LSAT2_022174 [Lamellibrachia satsuma]
MLNVQTEKKPVLDEDNDSDGDVESEKDSVPSFDLGALFEHTSLRSAATKVMHFSSLAVREMGRPMSG